MGGVEAVGEEDLVGVADVGLVAVVPVPGGAGYEDCVFVGGNEGKEEKNWENGLHIRIRSLAPSSTRKQRTVDFPVLLGCVCHFPSLPLHRVSGFILSFISLDQSSKSSKFKAVYY